MRVFIGARRVTSLEFQRAETPLFKLQVSGIQEYTVPDLPGKSLYFFIYFLYWYKNEGNLAKLFLKSSKCFRKVLQRLVSWIIKQNAGN